MASNSSRLRSTGVSVLLIVVFVFIAAVFIGALEKAESCATVLSLAQLQACKSENLLAPGNLLHYNVQFIQSLVECSSFWEKRQRRSLSQLLSHRSGADN